MYMIAIHPVLQYCYVIARDLPVIGVIVRKIGGFDEVIDVRSPAEFEDDHIPGASEFYYSIRI